MMNALLQQVLEKCSQEHWYGPELRGPKWQEVAVNDPRKHQFTHHPASQAQIVATERALVFPLPSLLRSFYMELANGGFGPGYGIRTLFERDAGVVSLTEQYYWSTVNQQPVHLEDFRSQWEQVGSTRLLRLAPGQWPSQMLSLCEWGDAVESCLDVPSGQVFRVGPMAHKGYGLRPQADSLEAWLLLWIRDELSI